MARVSLQGISKHFGDTRVLAEVDLEIADGEFLTLVGPSGCGKSTLLRIIAGLETQSAGTIALDHQPMDRVRPSERNLAMVFQSYALYPHLSVFDNIAVPLRMRDLSAWQRMPIIGPWLPATRVRQLNIEKRVKEVADTLGLRELLDRKPGQLSGGQRQRVAVGRAIIRNPVAFLFDEPLSNLDAKLRVHMRAEISQLHRQLQSTFIYVTHDQAEAMTMSDRIAIMMDGKLVQVGSPAEVYHDPMDARVAAFIGSPRINLLPAERDGAGRLLVLNRPTGVFLPDTPDPPTRLGIRPEALSISRQPAAPIQGAVHLLENLGAEVFLHLSVPGNESGVVVRLSPHEAGSLRVGDDVGVTFDPRDALLFDDSGRRVSFDDQLVDAANG